jgi:hypothetical protein
MDAGGNPLIGREPARWLLEPSVKNELFPNKALPCVAAADARLRLSPFPLPGLIEVVPRRTSCIALGRANGLRCPGLRPLIVIASCWNSLAQDSRARGVRFVRRRDYPLRRFATALPEWH